MIKLKKGFTLAELLISLGILSIIATIGFTLTKQGIDRAYDMYLYTGYKGLHDAILDANANGLYIRRLMPLNNNFFTHISSALNGSYTNNNNVATISAPNGITYEFKYHGLSATSPNFGITMHIPYKKTRRNGSVSDTLSTCLTYLPEGNLGILVPAPANSCNINRPNTIDLRSRIDLLPFYIDDGMTGRNIRGNFTPRSYYSAEEAICSVTNSNVSIVNQFGVSSIIYNCVQLNLPQVIGAIKPAHPRKIR